MEGLSCLGADDKTNFDATSFAKTALPAVAAAAAESISKEKGKTSDVPVDATGKKPGGASEGSFLTSPTVLVVGGAAVLGLGYFLLRR